MTGRRISGTNSTRDRIAAATPLPPLVGSLVGKANLHGFRELTIGLGGSQCADCLGWVDDGRHTYRSTS